MKYLFLFLFIFVSNLQSQGLNLDATKSEYIINEIYSIQNAYINEDLFLFPVREKVPPEEYINLFQKINKTVKLEPIFAMRFSSSGFELDSANTPSSVLWITPGVKITTTIPLINPMSGIWFYAWGRFHKHSAYGFNGNEIDLSSENYYTSFNYTPYNNTEYIVNTEKPDNGVDFDEGQGGIALISKSSELVFGKFNSSLGPFARGNLSISQKAPSFQQFRFHTNISDKFHFTYLVGNLNSTVVDSSLLELYQDDSGQNRLPQLPRYVIQHRLDVVPKTNFRFGLYEQIITGAKLSMNYLNPLMPYWSAQHSNGDIDNLQMGLDWEWIVKTNRIYGAFYMDEWSPYKTFTDDNHNWFAWQFGFSSLLRNSVLLKMEYANLTPQIYTHKFEINIPEHNGYPLGYWSRGDSHDFIASLNWLKGQNIYTISYENTSFGTPEYNIEAISNKNKLREVFTLSSQIKLPSNFNLGYSLSYMYTKNIYKNAKYYDATVSIMYNIKY